MRRAFGEDDLSSGVTKNLFDYGFLKLIIENLDDSENQIKVPIHDPTKQYPDD